MKKNILLLIILLFCIQIIQITLIADPLDIFTQDQPFNALPLPSQEYPRYTKSNQRRTVKPTKTLKKKVRATAIEETVVFGSKKKLKINFDNTTNKPALANIFVNQHSDSGYFGYPIVQNSTSTLKLPEFYWFSKVATGGVILPGEPSRVRLIEILNHSFANKLTIVIPDQNEYNFDIIPQEYSVKIFYDDQGNIIIDITE